MPSGNRAAGCACLMANFRMTTLEDATGDAWFKLDAGRLDVGGAWTIAQSARLDRELNAADWGGRGSIEIDGAKISRLDSAGAWLLLRTRRTLEAAGRKVSRFDLPALYGP